MQLRMTNLHKNGGGLSRPRFGISGFGAWGLEGFCVGALVVVGVRLEVLEAA